MKATIRTYRITPAGHELSGVVDPNSAEVPDAPYVIDDVIWLDGRKLLVTGREWENGKLVRVHLSERVPYVKGKAA